LRPVADGRVGRRDNGTDVARAIAIVGMFMIHASLAATGRPALTWYVLHVGVLVSLCAMGAKNALSTAKALLVGVALFGGAVWWSGQRRTTRGLFEGMIQRLIGAAPV
jgi:hypothetical protein